MKKIALIGTHGVRKTTHAYGIAHKLKELGNNIEMVSEVARNCPFPINEKTTPKAQFWILCTQISREIEKEAASPNYIICDRGTIDNYAYYVSAFGRDKLLDSLVSDYSKKYDFIFKVPIIDSEIEPDGFRSTSPDFQKKIDSIINVLLKDFDIKHYQFTSIDDAIKIIG